MPKIYKDIPIGFHRVNRMPLDDSEIINGNEALFNYIQSGSAYNGQRIIILYENNNNHERGTKREGIVDTRVNHFSSLLCHRR